MEIKIGDLVELKTGGPTMTVIGSFPPDYHAVTVAWFVETTLHKEDFSIDSLKKVGS